MLVACVFLALLVVGLFIDWRGRYYRGQRHKQRMIRRERAIAEQNMRRVMNDTISSMFDATRNDR